MQFSILKELLYPYMPSFDPIYARTLYMPFFRPKPYICPFGHIGAYIYAFYTGQNLCLRGSEPVVEGGQNLWLRVSEPVLEGVRTCFLSMRRAAGEKILTFRNPKMRFFKGKNSAKRSIFFSRLRRAQNEGKSPKIMTHPDHGI